MDIQMFNFPTPTHFGPGARRMVAELLDDWGLSRPLIITDRDVAQLAIFSDLDDSLRAAGMEVGVFAEIDANPVQESVVSGVQTYRLHHADAIVAFGGGAALDVAKAVGLMVNHPGALFDYALEALTPLPVDGPLPMLIAVPTTPATGSEVGRAAVIADDTSHIKHHIFDPRLMPAAAVIDPELTVKLPAELTATAGLSALAQNIEAYLAVGFNPLCDGIALEGVRLVSQHLLRAYEAPDNLEARGAMQCASLMGAVAQQKGLGLAHGLAGALSTVCGLSHALGLSVVLPHVVAFNAAAVPDRVARVAEAAGLQTHSALALRSWIEDLQLRLGVPMGLGGAGVQAAQLPRLAEVAAADLSLKTAPRTADAAELHQLLSEAL